MLRLSKTDNVQRHIDSVRAAGHKIGYVPTLGALHEGHMSLIRQSKMISDYTVSSIYVNPTQFNDPTDLKKYPRTIREDAAMLRKAGCDLIFEPGDAEIYPEGMTITPELDMDGLEHRLEGAHRPGHFHGVVQVVDRLLEIVRPDFLFLGQKDFQQVAVLKRWIEQNKIPVEVVMCPIIREENGLAMSSRNRRLSAEMRKEASILYKALCFARDGFEMLSLPALKSQAISQIEASPLKLEYLEFVDGNSLIPVARKEDSNYIVACVAAWADDVRLIDNVILDSPKLGEVMEF